ncbi:hypothetical protein [Streptomyces sp. NPDC051000]|uniref:hypothetical protein n=1 Tax=unclassified Streptomyces TaxID=2593676 RepID=UPI0033D5E9AC
MPTSTRAASVLTALALALGGAALPLTAHADIPACTGMVERTGVEVTDAVTKACHRGVVNDLQSCVSGLTGAGVPAGAANGACRAAPHEPR